MGLDFIGRTLRTFGTVLLIFLPFGLYYFGMYPALAILSGGVWGMINLIFLSELVKATIRPGGIQIERAIVFGVVKFPLLYLTAYALLKIPVFTVTWLLIGFSGIFLIMLLKSLGRILLGLDNQVQKQELRRAS
jgi:hypothetical protein